jgi:hypothetical protein
MTASNSGRGHFFAIDQRNWAKAWDCGVNEAVAYLTLACGTGRDNRTTSWSSEAIHKYTGVAWSRGKQAIENLCRAGLIGRAEAHTRQKPRYALLLTSPKASDDESNELIWLPNSIVTGTPNGEISPVHRLRSYGDAWALRLFVDLYHAQNLRDDGGISPQVIREGFDRKKISEHGIFNVWGYKQGGLTLWPNSPPFVAHKRRPKSQSNEDAPEWQSVKILQEMGLMRFVPHLLENDSPQAEIIHPLGIGRNGEELIETEIGVVARAAAERMCAEWVMQHAEDDGFDAFCPIPRSLPNVQLVGIARLRYRPRTGMTAAWYANLQESGRAAKEKYEELPFRDRTQKKERFA